jgi:hypothetical protein
MSTSPKTEIVRSPCSSCQQQTKHEVRCVHEITGDEDYSFLARYMVVECRGCGKVSFRYLYRDYEQAFPISDDEWDVPEDVETYPKVLDSHRELDGIHRVPDLVSSVYEETLTAIREGAGILAGLGLRGTIEAICNEQNITGRNLEVRITKLATQGLISQKDSERLHAIRFLGNDAAHEIIKPGKKQIAVALKIIDHLIVSVYILGAEADKALDTVVSEYEKFLELLRPKLKSFKSGDELPLAKLLERDVRRVQGGLSAFETQLIADISAGKFTTLTVGKVDNYGGSPTRLQHFILS